MKRIVIALAAAMLACAATENVYASQAASESTVIEKKKKTADIRSVTFTSDLHCANCAKKIKENIAFEKGVKALEVSVENHSIKISYDASKTDAGKLAEAIRKLGYSAELAK